MPLRDDIERQFIEAMKAKDAERLSALRNLRSAVKNAEIDKRPEPLTDADVLDVTAREVKKLRDAQADFAKAGREDLVAANRKEIEVLSAYLPAQLSEDEIRTVIKERAAALGLSGPAAFGKLMGDAMAQLKGKADGGAVGKIVKEVLGA